MKLQLNWIKWSANGRTVGMKGPAGICDSLHSVHVCASIAKAHPHLFRIAHHTLHIFYVRERIVRKKCFGAGQSCNHCIHSNRPLGSLHGCFVFVFFCLLSGFMVSFFRLSGGSKQKNLSRRRIYWWGEGVLFIRFFFCLLIPYTSFHFYWWSEMSRLLYMRFFSKLHTLFRVWCVFFALDIFWFGEM